MDVKEIPTPEALGLVDPYSNRYFKEPKISTDYVPELENMTKLSSAQKRQLLAATLALPNGFQKLGEAFVGPILLKLKYQGLLRDILVETPLAKGEPPEYDVNPLRPSTSNRRCKTWLYAGNTEYPSVRVCSHANRENLKVRSISRKDSDSKSENPQRLHAKLLAA